MNEKDYFEQFSGEIEEIHNSNRMDFACYNCLSPLSIEHQRNNDGTAITVFHGMITKERAKELMYYRENI